MEQPPSNESRLKADKSSSNKRAHARFRFEKRIQVLELHSGLLSLPVKVMAHDLSAGGMAFLSRGMMHVGTRLAVLLMANGKPLLRVCRVTQCRYDQQLGRHVVGAKWLPTPARLPVQILQTSEGLALSSLTRGGLNLNEVV